ncbi:MAG: molybdopterin biosynthesis protein MoeB [Novosphingobium sp. 63-713]|uniref:HesA/MoeB/ThiF family protein n=1 Tax=unclassified Novosphingobium TaxID=2644732 RepID=UPI00086B2EC4|nr:MULTISPECIES: HesA/MoeB/ThiF family protein [unclassified Novosphingobium]MBN9145018.1 HesA/MoeB/ThiF family protein [Novosphingobium sp.]MDR6708939.1 molybdopterin/thiamine biosynthesis adenylyltransferase [Novosphingobium sp. 1748]ODU71015.1 MAG: molybdopterin biosynthesis protein MoeB [Novosphingobium sp. SCN 66-18]OJX89963.1 MAG: molybdopterin biosynthesis protein MoeB [Novosphingobium sp. 63-713]
MTPERLSRFARHIVLPEVGGVGQMALADAHVVMIGCGGIGSPALQYLAAAGVGRLTLIDDDSVEASNLQRQTIFAEADIGMPKAQAAAAWIARFDPEIAVRHHQTRISADNAPSLIADATLVLDGCDNFATRLAVSDACVAAGIPLTAAAVGRFQGQIANFAGHLPGHACYRCFVGDAFDATDCDTCAADGVLGAFVGMVGTMAAQSAIRVILYGAGVPGPLADPQWGRLHLLDGLAPSLRTITIPADPACPFH